VLESSDIQRGDIVIFDEKIHFQRRHAGRQTASNSIVVIEFKQPGPVEEIQRRAKTRFCRLQT